MVQPEKLLRKHCESLALFFDRHLQTKESGEQRKKKKKSSYKRFYGNIFFARKPCVFKGESCFIMQNYLRKCESLDRKISAA